MAEERTVYCGSCGGELSASALFCRSCGAPQEEFTAEQPLAAPLPAPPTPPPTPAVPQPEPASPQPQVAAPSTAAWSSSSPAPSASSTANRVVGALAILGGIGMCFMVLYAIVYVPLHDHFPFAFGEPLEFGDILAFASGVVAICVGALALRRAPASPLRSGALLMLAGLLPIVLVVVWALPETLHLDYNFGRPFYFGFVYFCELGKVHIGQTHFEIGYENGYVQVPLAVSSVLVLLAGATMAFARRQPGVGPGWR